jgi:arginyl-tRNA synthetase
VSRSNTDLNLYIADKIRESLSRLAQQRGQEIEIGHISLVPPKNEALGDLGLACFPFAKSFGMNPVQLCAELAESMATDGVIERVQPTGPFLNVRLSRAALAQVTIEGVLQDQAPFGPFDANGQKVIIDYSSPNIAKPFHLGHLRSTVIGAALRRLYLHTGHEVHGINHLGD